MFSSPYAAPARRGMTGNLYRNVGVETAIDAADPHRLVAMLFDGVLESIAQARGAIRHRNVALKGRAIGRAARIVEEGLKAALDLGRGGELARDLDGLYRYLTLRLTQANLHDDERALDECRRLVEPLRSAWREIAPVPGAPAAAA